jgi:hypothetical protein
VSNTSVVSIRIVEEGFSVKLEEGGLSWTVEMSTQAYRTLLKLPNSSNDYLGIFELRDFGFINLTNEGDMDHPLAMSPLGSQVAKELAELQFEPVGTVKTFDRAPVDDKLWQSLQRKTKLLDIGLGASLMILAVAILNLGYQIVTGIASFLALVIKGGGEPGKSALDLMADPWGLLGQLAFLVVCSMVIPLLVGAMKVRHALNSPAE